MTTTQNRPAILITQCLQNDFTQLLGPFDALPNQLHVGYDESHRLLGERVEEGPVNSVMEWAYAPEQGNLEIIHIRDWHNANDSTQADHLRQFGEHCIMDTPGAQFVFRDKMRAEKGHHIVDASGLNDFVETNLEQVLAPFAGSGARVGVMGVWTEAKVSFLSYELKTRYPNFDIAVCSALTASSSREKHFLALEHLRDVLGIRVFESIGEFTSFLNDSMPAIAHRLHPRHDGMQLQFEQGTEISDTDRKLLLYLYRQSREMSFRTLDGGFSGNVVLKAATLDIHGRRQYPTVVKIGPRKLIAKERIAFERIQEVLGNNAPSIVDFAEVDDRGAIKYSYASMDLGPVQTFQDIYEATDQAKDEERLISILDVVFNEQLGRLYSAASSDALDLLEYYEFHYFIDNPEAQGRLRKRVEDLLGGDSITDWPIPAGVELADVRDFYERELAELKDHPSMAHYQAYLHGDLNGKNIIIDALGNTWLIDFFHTHSGHVLKDLIKLENDILYIFTKIESEDEFREGMELSRRLIDLDDLWRAPDPADAKDFKFPRMRKAWRVIAYLRSLYAELIQSDRNTYQLHVGLMRYAMHTLSFEECTEYQRKWALFSASMCARLISDYLHGVRRLRVDFMDVPDSSGRIGLTILPGRRDRRRNMDEDLRAIRENKIDHVLCLITEDEFRYYGVPELKQAYEDSGLQARYLPIMDGRAPAADALHGVLDWMDTRLKEGENILIHCVGGL